MLSKLSYILHSGKNNKFVYMSKNYLMQLVPNIFYCKRLDNVLGSLLTSSMRHPN